MVTDVMGAVNFVKNKRDGFSKVREEQCCGLTESHGDQRKVDSFRCGSENMHMLE